MPDRIIPDSYRLPGSNLYAGEYVGAPDPAQAERKLQRFLEAGITVFVDLTEHDEGLEPYADLLDGRATHVRLPIPDGGVPTPQQMRLTLDTISGALAAGEHVYVHCWGGIGRTKNADFMWKAGDSFVGDPPQEPQGLYCVFDTDESTVRIIAAHARRMSTIRR